MKKIVGTSKTKSQVMIPSKVMFLINPLNWKVTKTLSVVGHYAFIQIVDKYGDPVETQSVKNGEKSEFYFIQTLKSFEVKVLFVQEFVEDCQDCSLISSNSSIEVISNDYISIGMSNGYLSNLIYNGKEYRISSQLFEYDTANSGVYLFTPVVRFI